MVDDEAQIRGVMRATLAAHNYEVVEAGNGEEALSAISAEVPDLVLLDMNMPGMGGLETCQHLRCVSDVPVIILSVRDSEKDKVAALDAGADDYITKPFGIEELLARIRAALRRAPIPPEGGPHSFGHAGPANRLRRAANPSPGKRDTPHIKGIRSAALSRFASRQTRAAPRVAASPLGGRTAVMIPNSCGASSISCARRSSRTQPSRSTS